MIVLPAIYYRLLARLHCHRCGLCGAPRPPWMRGHHTACIELYLMREGLP